MTTGAKLRWWRDPMHIAVHALGITQITAWGTSYYCLGVLGSPIAADMGWSRSFVYLGYTVALLAMALVSTSVGRMIDRAGARVVMSAGTVIVSVCLLALSEVREQWAYIVVWIGLGLGMRCCLYDAAFAALVQVTPTRGRRAISYLTLYGAFASSIFWVIGHFLNEALGWRQTLLLFAAINLVLCLPLHWFGLARREDVTEAGDAAALASGHTNAADAAPALEGRRRMIGIWLFAAIMSLNGFVFSVISLQLVPMLEAAGLATVLAVWVASLKGVAQFAGRLVEIVFGRNLSAITVARIAIGVLPVSLALLIMGQGITAAILAFTLLMGASQGVITIVRGAVPLALFGSKGYGEVLGLIATPILVLNALAPTVFALLVDRWGWQTSLLCLFACAVASAIAMEQMARWYSRGQAVTHVAS